MSDLDLKLIKIGKNLSHVTLPLNMSLLAPLLTITCTEAEFMNDERTISLGFLGIILRVLRLEVFVYKVYYITNQFQTIFAQGGEEE